MSDTCSELYHITWLYPYSSSKGCTCWIVFHDCDEVSEAEYFVKERGLFSSQF